MIFMKTLYCNGTILTMNPDMPEADYLVSEDDRILAVGTGQYAGDYGVCHPTLQVKKRKSPLVERVFHYIFKICT